MKMGPIDGTTEEVKNLIVNSGLNIEDYLEKVQPPLRIKYVKIPIILFFVILFIYILLPDNSPSWLITFFYVLSFGCGTWGCTSIQIRFKNTVATFCVALGAIFIILLAAGLLSPKDAVDIIKELKTN